MAARTETLEDREVAAALLGEEAEELIGAAWRARLADRELADELGRPAATGAAASTAYLHALAGGPALPGGVEERLVRAAKAGDAIARARLVEAFLPQISSMARIYRQTPTIQRLELLQEGVVGLLRAIERYDPDRGAPFWSYASWWVRQAMQQLVAELTRPTILSDRALRELARVRDAQREALAAADRPPRLAEIARRAGLSPERVQTLLALDRPVRSLDEQLSDEEGERASLGELLDDPLAEAEYERVLDAIEAEELLALLSGLSDREREILRARYGLDGEEQSLAEVAGRLGVSAERVRQLEQRALAKLRAAARSDGRARGRTGRPERAEANAPRAARRTATDQVAQRPASNQPARPSSHRT
jgi:RNA polymerase primary sigma factor